MKTCVYSLYVPLLGRRIYLGWTSIYLSNICRQAEGRKWILFFQDTNGLLFKVCAGLTASVFPALVIFSVVLKSVGSMVFHLSLILYITSWFSFTTGYPSSTGCKFNSRFGCQLTCSAPESKRSNWRNFETHSWKRLVRAIMILIRELSCWDFCLLLLERLCGGGGECSRHCALLMMMNSLAWHVQFHIFLYTKDCSLTHDLVDQDRRWFSM